MNTWNKPNGTKNYKLARHATKTLLKKLQDKTGKKLEEILPTITQDTFYHTPINKYNTKLSGMLTHVYDHSPYQALKDFAVHDKEFEQYRSIIEKLKHRT